MLSASEAECASLMSFWARQVRCVLPVWIKLLSTVLHDWNDQDAQRILERIRAAAPRGARLVVVDVVLPDGDDHHLGKISDLTMLAIVGGRERTRSEFTELLARSGFVLDRVARSSVSGYSVLVATLQDS